MMDTTFLSLAGYQSITGKMIVTDVGTVHIGFMGERGYTQGYELEPSTSDLMYMEGAQPHLDKLAIQYRSR